MSVSFFLTQSVDVEFLLQAVVTQPKTIDRGKLYDHMQASREASELYT